MKKTILITLLVLPTLFSYGQTKKGSRLIGADLGGINYGTYESTTTYSNSANVSTFKSTDYSAYLAPTVAWFLANNLALGGVFGFNYNSTKYEEIQNGLQVNKSTNSFLFFNIGPLLRYYFIGGLKGKAFADIMASKSIYQNSNYYDGKGNNGRIRLGFEHFYNENIGFYATIGIQFSKVEQKDTDAGYYGSYTLTNKIKSMDIPISFGLQIHCSKKPKK